jgi:hypothetical protein
MRSMSWAIASIVCVAIGFSSSAFADITSKSAKAVWGKALKKDTIASTSMRGLSKLGLSPSARQEVKATLKKSIFFGPTEKTIYTLNGNGQAAKSTFGVHIFAPGYDTGSSDFVAKQVTKVFSRKTGKLLGSYNLTWDGNSTLFDGWEKLTKK